MNDDFRLDKLPHRSRRHPRRGFAQANPQIPPRVFEFLEVMLPHKTEKLLDLLDFGIGERRTAG
jgi:hypothetical protein